VARALEGRTAVVTGATRGIGRAIAPAFAEAGADLVLVGRSSRAQPHRFLPGTLEEVEAEAARAGGRVVALRADLSRDEDLRRIAQVTAEQFGGCDILIHNAAVTFLGPFLEVPVSRWRAVLAVNLLAAVALSHALLPAMLARGAGHIVHLSSGSAQADRGPLQLPYAVSKAALERLTTGLHHQFHAQGLHASCVRIDEVIPTEGAAWGAPEVLAQARSSAADLARALVWLVSAAPDAAGRIVPLEELRARGALASSLAGGPG
jgi:3-oxoacyl-[acyl-carrier protein] reductase